ncbi:dTDP-4-dehydrorhamnose 3,5-epimerase [soil metagenome]
MRIERLKLDGTHKIVLDPKVDSRGHFVRTYDRKIFEDHYLSTDWEQESSSYNDAANTILGLHFQIPPQAETKIVRVSRGAVLDVFVDLRKASVTYRHWDSITLSAENNTSVYIPQGFAHGFRTLVDDTVVEYKINAGFRPELTAGIRWNDETLGIDWGVDHPIISERDAELPVFELFHSPF